MNPIRIASQGKGPLGNDQTRRVIAGPCGLTPARMDWTVADFAKILGRFRRGASLPITGLALTRRKRTVEKYEGQGIEFAVHGYQHGDHTQLSLREQLTYFARARRLFMDSYKDSWERFEIHEYERDDLARCIRNLYMSRERLAELPRGSYEFNERCNWTRIGGEYVALIERMHPR